MPRITRGVEELPFCNLFKEGYARLDREIVSINEERL